MLRKFFSKKKQEEPRKANREIEEAINNLRNVMMRSDMHFGALFAAHSSGMFSIMMPEEITNKDRVGLLRDLISTARDTLRQYEGAQ